MPSEADPHRLAFSSLMDAAAWLHSIGTAPGYEDSVLSTDALAAATEVMDLVAAYFHLWPETGGAPQANKPLTVRRRQA